MKQRDLFIIIINIIALVSIISALSTLSSYLYLISFEPLKGGFANAYGYYGSIIVTPLWLACIGILLIRYRHQISMELIPEDKELHLPSLPTNMQIYEFVVRIMGLFIFLKSLPALISSILMNTSISYTKGVEFGTIHSDFREAILRYAISVCIGLYLTLRPRDILKFLFRWQKM